MSTKERAGKGKNRRETGSSGASFRAGKAAVFVVMAACLMNGGGFLPGAFFPASGGGQVILASQADNAQSDTGTEYDPVEERVPITIPGMEESCTLLWVSDMHICSGPDDGGVTDGHREEAAQRYEMLRSPSGLSSGETWDLISGRIDSYKADYVIFGADLLDYVSEENLDRLQKGLEGLQTPWMYIRADHDYGRWYGDMKLRKMRRLHREIAPQNKLWVQRFDDFTVAGLDNTTTAVAPETLEEFRAVCGEGKPIILCTHVPFDTGQGDTESLRNLSGEGWGGRVLCWGDGDEYDTSSGGTMKELLDLICAADSPVCAVLAGHLHQSWDGMLTDTCTGHVFSAAYEDHIGVITVSGS